MVNALNVNSTVGIFFKDWVDIVSGETLEYEVSLYEDADTDKVMFCFKRVLSMREGHLVKVPYFRGFIVSD